MVASRQFDEAIADLMAKTGRTREDLVGHAESCLDEMSAEVEARAMRAWDRLGAMADPGVHGGCRGLPAPAAA